MLQTLGSFFVRLSHRYIPNPLVFALLLSVLIYVLGITATDTTPFKMIEYWYGGFWNLLGFGMQMVALLLFGYVLASSPPVRAVISWAARFPRNSGQAIILITVLAMVFSLINWGLGLIVGAISAREVCRQARARGIRVHFPLAAAAGFSALMVFACGFSATAPLLMASEGHFLFKQFGQVPITQTILTPYNLIIVLTWMVVMPFVYRAMQPADHEIEEIPEDASAPASDADAGASRVDRGAGPSAEPVASYRIADDGTAVATMAPPTATSASAELGFSLAERLDKSRLLSWAFAAAGLSYVAYHFATRGFDLNLNIVNFMLLVAGVLAYRTPIDYVHAIDDAARACGQIVLQFPFYAGLMGMMAGSGLITMFSNWMVAISTPGSFPVVAFISAALVNVFVPSAGGQWAIQGAPLMEAARQLGVDYGVTIMAFTYGDQLTNGIQPFWMLPLLGVTFLKAREICGYTAVIMIVAFFIFALGLTLLPPLFL